MNRLLQHFVADGDDNGGSDWANQRVQETHTPPFAAPAPSPSPPANAFEDIPLSSSTTGAKYDTVDLFDDGKKGAAAFPPAPPPPVAAAASEEPAHDFFGSSQPAHDPFGSVAHAPQHDPFAASPALQNSPFASAPDSHQHSPFGSSSADQSSPFGSSAGHQSSPFTAAQAQQRSRFGAVATSHDPSASTPEPAHSPFGSATHQHEPSPFGSATEQPSPFGSASELSSPFGSSSENHASPLTTAPDSQSSPFGSASEQQQDSFAATPGQQSQDPFAATPEAYSQTSEQQYYQGQDQYAQHQYDSNGYDYYQQQYYDQYQQQQYGGDQGYGGQYQYSAEEYQYYQAQNGEQTEEAASVFGQQYHQHGYEYTETPAGAEASAASPVPHESTPSVDSSFNSSVQPPVSSGSPFDQPAGHSEAARDQFAQSAVQATDYFHHQQQHAPFSQDSMIPTTASVEENQATSELQTPVQDFFSSSNSSHADASSLFSSSTPAEDIHSGSYFGSSQSPTPSASAPSPVSHHVESPAPIAITHVPATTPLQVEDKSSQLQGAFASLGISSHEGANPADQREDSNERPLKTKSRTTSSTLDDTIRLAEMYKQMAERMQTEKNDLLKVLADQTDQFYQMQDYIHSLEREVEEYRSKDTGMGA